MAAECRPSWAKTVAEHIAESQADELIAEITAQADQTPEKK